MKTNSVATFACAIFIAACGAEQRSAATPAAATPPPPPFYTVSASSPAANNAPVTASEPSPPPTPPGPSYRDPGSWSNTFASNPERRNDASATGTAGSDAPTAQAGSDSDGDVSAAVRRAIFADKSLAAIAQSVRVTASGNRITLRGTVNTSEQKKAIERIARGTDGVRDVSNQLQVNE